MGNNASTTFQKDNIFQSRQSVIDECNTISHANGKNIRIVHNTKYVLKIACARQVRANRPILSENTERLKEHISSGGQKSTFVKTPLPQICTGCVIAKPVRNVVNYDSSNPKYIIH